MTVYLSFLDRTKYAQQLVDTPSFQAKHKISVNNPVKTHYTVEGVQSYAPEELKALKERQDRTMQGKEGTYAPLKVVLLSDQVIQFQERDPTQPSKRQQQKIKANQTLNKQQQKQRPSSTKPKVNARNAHSSNTQAIVKLEKEVAKRNSLQRKLQKMSEKYKQYFKDVDLKEGFNNTKKGEQEGDDGDNGDQELDEEHESLDKSIEEAKQPAKSTNFDKNSSSTRPATAKPSKNIQNSQKVVLKQLSQTIKESEEEADKNSQVHSQKSFLGIGFDLVTKSATFSEKLGSAIHEIFK